MPRPIAEIDTDLAAARADQDTVLAAQSTAAATLADLRSRATAGDGSVKSAAIAKAAADAEYSALPIATKRAAVVALEQEMRGAIAEQTADEVTATVQPLATAVTDAMTNVETALQSLEYAWHAHAAYALDMSVALNDAAQSQLTPRIRRGPMQDLVVDGQSMRVLKVAEQLQKLVTKTSERLYASGHRA